MSHQTKPPYILAFAADGQGCGFHRTFMPLGSLIAANLVEGRVDMRLMDEQTLRATAPDVIVWQRQVETRQLENMRMARKACPDAFFIYELDDHLGDVPFKSYHSGFMPEGLEDRVREGLSLCDAATTTTDAMAEWLTSMGVTDVRVIPNLIPMGMLKEREPKPGAKLRVGWGGGISHAGDLDLLTPAMAVIGEEVQWVFLGMQPEKPPCRVEYHPGVPPHVYLEQLRSLDLDIVVAPLEQNVFNECKSNLRIIEAGAIGACVIAQDIRPYQIDNPPVHYATKPEDWATCIRNLMAEPASTRARRARALTAWVAKRYTVESRLHDRLAAWSPPGEAKLRWRPRTVREGGGVAIACQGGRRSLELPHALKSAHFFDTLDKACEFSLGTGCDVLWARPGVAITEHGWDRLRTVAGSSIGTAEPRPVAAVVPVAPDGINAFPNTSTFVPTDPEMGREIDGLFAARMCGVPVAEVPFAGGPCVLLDRRAIAMFGSPDGSGCNGHEEVALVEWSLRVLAKGWTNAQVTDCYVSAINPPAPPGEALVKRLAARGYGAQSARSVTPLSPEVREAVEIDFVRSRWAGPTPGSMGFANDYESWSALKGPIVVPEGPRVTVIPVMFGTDMDKTTFRDDAWFVFTDESVHLRPNALERLAVECELAGHQGASVVYADHEVVGEGKPLVPFFKPDFDAERFLGQDYVTQICAVRSNHCLHNMPQDRVELYEVLLGLEFAGFHHVPEVLATVREPDPEALGLETMRRRVVLEEYFGDNAIVTPHSRQLGALSIVRQWRPRLGEAAPLVSIVVPSPGDGWMLQPCINTLLKLTRYPNFEIIVVHTREEGEPELGEAASDPRVRWFKHAGPFNWSVINNLAIRDHAKGEYICTVNDDVRVASQDWLDVMMGQVLVSDVGAVGARLIYPHGLVQHVGVVVHKGLNGHAHKNLPVDQPGMHGLAVITHEATAVTGAVMLFSRKTYDAVGGFDERFAHNYNDVAFCLTLRKRGLRNVVECSAELLHMEGATRVSPISPEGMVHWRHEQELIEPLEAGRDHYWNPNFALIGTHGGMYVHGLDGVLLGWEQPRPADDADRVLLVNDLPGAYGMALLEKQGGAVCLGADLSGFTIRLMTPILQNSTGWDVRDSNRVAAALHGLGVRRIVLRSLVGAGGPAAPVEALNCLASVGIPIDARLIDSQAVCPRRDMTVGGVPCGEGWREGLSRCQGCIDVNGSPFGRVDVAAWWNAWAPLMPPVEVAEAAE